MTTKHHDPNQVEPSAATFEALNDVAHQLGQLRVRTFKAIMAGASRLRDRIADPSAASDGDGSPGEKSQLHRLHRVAHAVPAAEVAAAWEELREHPALQWVPPVWRTTGVPAGTQTAHTIRAIDRNLVVTVLPKDRGMCVRLATGPLVDRELNGRVDPTSPATTIDPSLDVVAESFDHAVLRLRNALVHKYGPVPTVHKEGRRGTSGGARNAPNWRQPLSNEEPADTRVRRIKQKR